MRYGPPVCFTYTANGSRLAYQVVGNGEHDLVFLLGWPTHLALMWENPAFAGFLHGLAAFSRLILLDHHGRGMSDRGPTGRPFEDQMDDVRTVLRAVGSERTAFFGCHLGGRLALLFAAPSASTSCRVPSPTSRAMDATGAQLLARPSATVHFRAPEPVPSAASCRS
jgi:hypothetical protein